MSDVAGLILLTLQHTLWCQTIIKHKCY